MISKHELRSFMIFSVSLSTVAASLTHPVIPSKLIADGKWTGSDDAVKLLSPNQHHTKITVNTVGTKASMTPSVGASATMWNNIEPWKFGGCRNLVSRRLIPHTMIASVTAIMLAVTKARGR